MARTAHPLKRPAKGASSASRRKRPRKCPRLDSLNIEVKCDHLSCSFLSINRRYCDEATEILKTRLSEKLTAAKVEQIGHLRIAMPDHITDLFEFFTSLSIQFTTLEVVTTIHSLVSDNWIDTALTLPTSPNVRLSLSEMYDGKTDLVAGIIDQLLVYGKASIELLDKESNPYVDRNLITDEYLLELAKKVRNDFELRVSSTLLTADGILEAVEAISKREVPARLQFQLDSNAREFKASIIEKWGLTGVIEREFDELNNPRTTPLEIDGYTLYNEGCENLCIYDGRIVLKMPTEHVLDGRLANKNVHPHRFTIERVMDKKKQLVLDRGFFEVKHK